MTIAAPSPSQRLSRQILMRVLLLGVMAITAATVTCYLLVYSQSKEKTLASLREYMFERKQLEERVFLDAAASLDLFRDEFMRLYLSDIDFSDDDFWSMYFVDGRGATRMKEKFFNESIGKPLGRSWGVTSFIGNNQPVDDHDFKRRLLIAYTLVNRYGPAWAATGALHASYPENAITIFSPEAPWGLQARPDLPMNELGTIKATLQSENPGRVPVWTGLYYDETVDLWTITYELPVDHEGRHLVNPSLDVHLDSIVNRLERDSQAGTYSFILSRSGYLIAHPGELKNELKRQGQLSLEKLANPDLSRMYRTLARAEPDEGGISVVEDAEGGNYLIAATLSGPQWWLVTEHPKHRIAQEAHQASRIVLLFGFLLFVAYAVTVYVVIARHVKGPLEKLQRATALVADGEYETIITSPRALPLEQRNEIGQLAGMFLDMCRKVNHVQTNLQELIASRTLELEAANARLRELSLLDGLTGIHNRRSFDRDLAAVFDQSQRGDGSFFLLLIDIDLFKDFNDTHGHTAGDEALRTVARIVAQGIRGEDRAYRYGGEEIAVILNGADAVAAHQCAARIVRSVRDAGIEHGGNPHGVVTISAGLAGYAPHLRSATDMIDAADASLYAAKAAGRNRLEGGLPE